MLAQDFIKAYPDAAHKIRVIHNGVDRTVYYPPQQSPADIRMGLGLAETGGVEFIFVGSGWARKGLATALRLLQLIRQEPDLRLAKARLTVIGKGRPRIYQKLVRELGLTGAVVFAGAVANPREYYQQADALLLPTLYDPFASTCLEALACGCAVITTNTNGAAEVIQEMVNGIIIPGQLRPGDLACEARRISHLLVNNHASKQEISATTAGHTVEYESTQYRSLFTKLIDE